MMTWLWRHMATMAFWKPNRYPSPDEVKGGELQCQTALQKHFCMVPSSNRMWPGKETTMEAAWRGTNLDKSRVLSERHQSIAIKPCQTLNCLFPVSQSHSISHIQRTFPICQTSQTQSNGKWPRHAAAGVALITSTRRVFSNKNLKTRAATASNVIRKSQNSQNAENIGKHGRIDSMWQLCCIVSTRLERIQREDPSGPSVKVHASCHV